MIDDRSRDHAELGVLRAVITITPLHNIKKRGTAQLKSNVEIVWIVISAKITVNNVLVMMYVHEMVDFAIGERNTHFEETFGGHCTALKGAHVDNSAR